MSSSAPRAISRPKKRKKRKKNAEKTRRSAAAETIATLSAASIKKFKKCYYNNLSENESVIECQDTAEDFFFRTCLYSLWSPDRLKKKKKNTRFII